MALSEPRRWLIAYDIREPRRLARVHKLLVSAAVPVQYSVFAAAGSTLAMRHLAAAVSARIDPRVDDVRFYPLPRALQAYTIGTAMIPDEVFLLGGDSEFGALLGRDVRQDSA